MIFLATPSAGQSISVSTNIAQWATLGTMNVEAGYAFSKHFSLHGGVSINPFSFRNADEDERYSDLVSNERKAFQYKRESVAVGVRYWPWHVFSGWWFRAKAQLQVYDRGGIFGKERYQGTAIGGGIGFGYAWMVSERWNIDFGVAGWAGRTKENIYEHVNSNNVIEERTRFFIVPDEVIISVVYIF